MKQIKILHASCCAKNSMIRSQIEKIAKAHQWEFEIEELSEMHDTMVYGTMTFPSLVVDGAVYDYRSYASDDALTGLLKS